LTTLEIAELIQNQAPGWNIDGGARSIRSVIDQVHRILKQNESSQNQVLDETGGELPVIITTGTKRTYELPDNVWRVGNIVIRIPLNDNFTIPILNEDFGFVNRRFLDFPQQEVAWGGRRYFLWNLAVSRERDRTGPAKVTFTVDPGDTTDFYRFIGWEKAKEISSTSVELDISEKYHQSHVIPACMKLIEGYQNGNYIEGSRYVEDTIKKDYQSEQNRGAQGSNSKTRRREF